MATLTIDRPDRRNAINAEVVRELTRLLTAAEEDEDVKAVVLTGSGDKAFCAGGDLGGMGGDSSVGRHFLRAEVGELFARMRASRLPVVARVNGHALAGGFGLMLACDLVVAADDAEMGMPEIDLGLWPFMVTALVRRDLPRKVALDLMLTGRRMGAAEGERWGFVNRTVPRARLDGEVTTLVERIAAASPLVVSLGKRSFYRSEDMAFDDQLAYLSGMLTLCLESEDAAEGISAFLQKRSPEWKGR
ncbi:MAG: enoyl-CoA hydratase-related protein [Actinomycetota bacterium]|nr:enoyl-CoA hydratase-related protein [Actinomycetota bacterium]